MSNARCVIYVINAVNDIFDAYDIGPVSHKNMSIWVSNEAAGPHKYRTMPLNVTKCLHDQHDFPLYFLNFPLYNVGALRVIKTSSKCHKKLGECY